MSRRALNEAKWILLTELILLLVLLPVTLTGTVLVLLLLLFTLWFFRDPPPRVPEDPRSIVAPATGRVDVIEEADEPLFRADRSRRVSIFLSVFDVHTQRAPVAGTVKLIRYFPGGFANAMRPAAAAGNEQQAIGLESEGGRVLVRQIAGLVARRICTWCQEGDRLAKGEPLGMIRFGSRVDIYLPLTVRVVAVRGQHVRGGESVIAEWA